MRKICVFADDWAIWALFVKKSQISHASDLSIDTDRIEEVRMQDIAECIVMKSRMLPVETGVALQCNGAMIAKVAVTGGFGFEVTSADKKSSLLFPKAELHRAVESFLTAAHVVAVDGAARYKPVVCHANGLPLLSFEWNDIKAKRLAQRSVSDILLQPPLCHEMQTAAKTSLSFDARGRHGWDIDSVQPMNEDPQEASESHEEDDDEE